MPVGWRKGDGNMANVSFLVVDGIDKGRVHEALETPVTLGREEGNAIRLNDERVSRFHAKVQEDHGQIVLTDLDSTNGTLVNGEPVQLRLLREGDQIVLGRSKLLFGLSFGAKDAAEATLQGTDEAPVLEPAGIGLDGRAMPPLPARLSPAQAAQLAEVVESLHRRIAAALEGAQIPAGGGDVRLPADSWRHAQSALAALARYSRMVCEPSHVDHIEA